MVKEVAIIGAGGFGREVKVLIDDINNQEYKFKFIGYFDDNLEVGTLVNGFPVLGGLEKLNEHKSKIGIALGIGNPQVKKSIIGNLNNTNLYFPILIHPSVHISNDFINIGKGSIICAGSIITCNIKIRSFVTLNLSCTVGHDTIIGEYSSFMPAVNISGEVDIENNVYVGTGAKIINQLKIGENTVIGAGAVVSKSLPSNCTAVGIPAKPIKFHS